MRKYLAICFYCASVISYAQTKSLYEEVTLLYTEEKFEECLKLESSLVTWASGRTDTLAANVLGYLANSRLNTGNLEKAIFFFDQERIIRLGLLPEGVIDYSVVLC